MTKTIRFALAASTIFAAGIGYGATAQAAMLAALTGDERVRRFVAWVVAEAERTTGRRRGDQPSPKVRL